MKRITLALFCIVSLSISGISQNTNQTTSPQAVTQTTSRPPLAFGLPEDTPIKLKLTRTISSKDAKVGDRVDFEVLEDVKAGDVVVVRQGGRAMATVTEAHSKRSFGRSGKLNVNVDYLQLVNGDKVPLRAIKGGSGGSRTGAMTGAVVATSIIFFPAAPLFFFIKGKNITIPQGTEITAYIAADTPLEASRFIATTPATQAAAPTAEEANRMSGMATVIVKSRPEAAEITVDGKFMGSTMSTLQLTPGEHRIRIEKSGYTAWERMITVNAGGNITVDASLDKHP